MAYPVILRVARLALARHFDPSPHPHPTMAMLEKSEAGGFKENYALLKKLSEV